MKISILKIRPLRVVVPLVAIALAASAIYLAKDRLSALRSRTSHLSRKTAKPRRAIITTRPATTIVTPDIKKATRWN